MRVKAALVVETIAVVAFVTAMRSRNAGIAGIALVLVAFGAWWVLKRGLDTYGSDVPANLARWLLVVMALVMLAAVVMPSRQSDDAFLYGIYGRITSVHHMNPYRTVPADVPGDAIARYVGGHWTNTPSYYGPAWIGWSALGTALVPATKLSIRLLFQLTSAATIAAIGFVLWRRTRSLVPAALVVLQPLIVLSVINGAHNDGAVALCSLGAVLLLGQSNGSPERSRRPVLAAVLFGLAASVKATAILGGAAAVLWLLIARRRRDATIVGAIAGGMTAVAFLATPGSISALQGAGNQTSFLSIWQTIRSAVHPSLLVDGAVWGPENFGAARAAPFVAGVATLLALLWLRPAIARGALGVEWAVIFGLSSYLVLGSWVQPWHLAWTLPLVALVDSPTLWRVVTAQCALVLTLFQAEDWIRTELWRPLRVLVIVGVPLTIAAGYWYAIREAASLGAPQADGDSIAPTRAR